MRTNRRQVVRKGEAYAQWLVELKGEIALSRRRAAMTVNSELVQLYWRIGRDIIDRQQTHGWGAKVIERLSKDLTRAFPGMRGFSRSNLMSMRAFAEAWPDASIVQQVVGQLSWGANVLLLSRVKSPADRNFYARRAIEHGWSRNVLMHHIDARLHLRAGKATTNFAARLPPAHAELAEAALKDPYCFDFLGISETADERAIENALMTHMTRFLLELGAGFAFVGKQVHLEVGEEDFYIDLLFFHLKLRCYVVIELKTGAFKPEHAGQLNFYLSAVDSQLKARDDNPTIGLLLCKARNRVVAEYALRDTRKPMGIAEYDFVQHLPSVAQLEKELRS